MQMNFKLKTPHSPVEKRVTGSAHIISFAKHGVSGLLSVSHADTFEYPQEQRAFRVVMLEANDS